MTLRRGEDSLLPFWHTFHLYEHSAKGMAVGNGCIMHRVANGMSEFSADTEKDDKKRRGQVTGSSEIDKKVINI